MSEVCRSSSARISALRSGRKPASAVARMDARLLDMLHHARNKDILPIANRVHIGFDGVADIGVQQKRVLGQHGIDLRAPVAGKAMLDILWHERRQRRVEIVLERRLIWDNRHRPPAKHVGRPDHDGEADLLAGQKRLLDGVGDAVFRLPELELVDEGLEAVAVLGQVDGVRRSAENGYVVRVERLARA